MINIEKEIEEFNNKLNNVSYGWYDKEKKLHKTIKKEDNFIDNFIMQTIEEINETNYAICWDLCEVERKFFKDNKIPFITILAIINDGIKMPNHTFLVYKNDNKYYWFESSWGSMKGIWEYYNLEDLFYDIKNNFVDFAKTKYDKNSIEFYEYDNVPQEANCKTFLNHCLTKGKPLNNAKLASI